MTTSRNDTQSTDRPPAETFPFSILWEINERCLDLLVNAARADGLPPFSLIEPLRDTLRQCGPALRQRTARVGLLLVNLEFHNLEWWQAVRAHPDKAPRTAKWSGTFPRLSAVPLTRATLMFAWHSIRADLNTACVVFGLDKPAAELISSLNLSQIDRIADRQYRHLHPRWHDQPLIWRNLLMAAQTDKPVALRNVSLHGLQLISGSLLP